MIRTKGEAGSGNIVEAVRHLRRMGREIRALAQAPRDELMARAKEYAAPYELVLRVAELGALPVPNFAAGGIATPADAALCMSLGAAGRVRRLGHLQVGRSGGAGARDRARDHALAGAEGGARGVARARRGHARARARGDSRSRAAGEARLVKVGVLALQGDFAAHARALAGVGAEPLLVRTPRRLRRPRRAGAARRRVDRDAARHRARRARAGRCARSSPRAGRCSAPAPARSCSRARCAARRSARSARSTSRSSATPTARSSTRSCVAPRPTTRTPSSPGSSAC